MLIFLLVVTSHALPLDEAAVAGSRMPGRPQLVRQKSYSRFPWLEDTTEAPKKRMPGKDQLVNSASSSSDSFEETSTTEFTWPWDTTTSKPDDNAWGLGGNGWANSLSGFGSGSSSSSSSSSGGWGSQAEPCACLPDSQCQKSSDPKTLGQEFCKVPELSTCPYITEVKSPGGSSYYTSFDPCEQSETAVGGSRMPGRPQLVRQRSYSRLPGLEDTTEAPKKRMPGKDQLVNSAGSSTINSGLDSGDSNNWHFSLDTSTTDSDSAWSWNFDTTTSNPDDNKWGLGGSSWVSSLSGFGSGSSSSSSSSSSSGWGSQAEPCACLPDSQCQKSSDPKTLGQKFCKVPELSTCPYITEVKPQGGSSYYTSFDPCKTDSMSIAMAHTTGETPLVVNIFAAVGLCVTAFGAFRHYTSK